MLVALAALFGAALTVAACYAAGAILIRWIGSELTRLEKIPLAFVLGAACLHLAVFAVLTLKLAYRPVLLVMLVGVIAAAGFGKVKARPAMKASWTLAPLGVIFGAFTVVYFVNAWAPESSPDGSGYHLELVARYLRVHGFERVITNMYASLAGGVEMLFVPAFALGKHSAAALVHFAFTIALALAMFAYGLRIAKPWVGAAGALLTYLSPIVGRDGTSAYIDVAVAAIAISIFYWLEIWDEQRDMRLLIPIGLLAGYAYATKYTAFVMAPYALGFVAWRARKLRPVLVVAACAAVMIAPWMIKNWIYLQNPVAPFFNQIFRNPNVHVFSEQDYSGWLRRYDVENKWTLPIEVTVRGGKTQGLIGAAFLAAPLALLALRYRAGRRLLAPGFLLLATYFTNVGTRFLIPCLPFFSLPIAMALGSAPVLLVLLVMFHAVTAWPWGPSPGADPNAWRIWRFPYEAALRKIPEDRYLRESLPLYPVARMVEEHVPPGERVLSMNGLPQSYTSREILVSFQSAFNVMLADMLNAARMDALQPKRMLVFHFPERGLRRVRLVQTAQGKDFEQWNVHELRFLDRGAELPRRPEWRLRAWPNPWDVQLAFDNSPVTRWRAWETAKPGMYIEVDFGRTQAVDEVDMETSHDYEWPIRLQVESSDAQGRWSKITDQFEERNIDVPASMRRAAAYELHARGVNYLLIQDSDYGAESYRSNPDAWGLKAVAHESGTTLYKVLP